MKNRVLIGLGLVVIALFAFGDEKAYILPDGSRVLEKDLPSKGYILYKERWYPSDLINKTGGFSFTTKDIQEAIKTGKGIWDRIKNVVELIKNFRSDAGLPASGTVTI